MHRWVRFIVSLIGPIALLLFAAGCGDDSPPDMRVLFIGNSYTHYNRMPETVVDLAQANDVDIEVSMIAPGGRFFADHAVNPDVIEAISSGNFDFVVLQEHSVPPAVPAVFSEQTTPAAVSLVRLARASDTKIIWFETWAHSEGSDLSGHTSFDSMQSTVSSAYRSMQQGFGGEIAPVGSAWRQARVALPELKLHTEDGSHPTKAGSYLAALVIAESLLDEVLAAPFEIDGSGPVSDDEAAALLALVVGS